MSESQSTAHSGSADSFNGNYSDDQLILKDFRQKCEALQSQKNNLIKLKKKLLMLNEKNQNISKSLLKIKQEYELYKSDLYRALFFQKVKLDKEKILSERKINGCIEKIRNTEEQSKRSPTALELEELIKINDSLLEEYTESFALLELTKKQFYIMKDFLIKNFRKKVCEFCDTVLRLNAFND